jgi:hypothetical protein
MWSFLLRSGQNPASGSVGATLLEGDVMSNSASTNKHGRAAFSQGRKPEGNEEGSDKATSGLDKRQCGRSPKTAISAEICEENH